MEVCDPNGLFEIPKQRRNDLEARVYTEVLRLWAERRPPAAGDTGTSDPACQTTLAATAVRGQLVVAVRSGLHWWGWLPPASSYVPSPLNPDASVEAKGRVQWRQVVLDKGAGHTGEATMLRHFTSMFLSYTFKAAGGDHSSSLSDSTACSTPPGTRCCAKNFTQNNIIGFSQ